MATVTDAHAETHTGTRPLRAVLYGRISREQGRTKKGTLQSDVEQEDETTTLAADRGFQVVSWDLDMDVSGGLFKRPGFQRALDLFRNGEADVMIVPALDRFGRDMKVIYKALEIIEADGGYLMSVKDRIENSRLDEGRTQIALYGMFAQIQLDRIKAGWKRAHVRHVAKGVASRVPWGYERGEGRVLVPTAEGRQWVPMIFRWRSEGIGLSVIARRLNEAGVRTRNGGQWRKDSVTVVLANRAYLGEVSYGELLNANAHEPLVDIGLWAAAQVKRATRPATRETGLLAGVLRCASCRYVMDFKPATRSYQCKGNHGAGRCPAPVSVNADQANAYVRAWVEGELSREQEVVRLAGGSAASPELLAALAEAQSATAMFQADLTREVRLGSERYNAQLDALLAREAELEAACKWSASEAKAPTPTLSTEDLWARSVHQQRAVITPALDAVFARGRPGRGVRLPIDGRLHICARGEGPSAHELPRRGEGGAVYVIREFIFPDDLEAQSGVLSGQ